MVKIDNEITELQIKRSFYNGKWSDFMLNH